MRVRLRLIGGEYGQYSQSKAAEKSIHAANERARAARHDHSTDWGGMEAQARESLPRAQHATLSGQTSFLS